MTKIEEYLPPVSFDDLGFWDLNSDAIIFEDFIGKGHFGKDWFKLDYDGLTGNWLFSVNQILRKNY